MKTIFAIIILPFVFLSFTGKNEKKRKSDKKLSEHTNVALDIIAHVENTSFDFKYAKYRLYRDNNFVSGGNSDRFGTMELLLMKNSRYLLELSAPGFLEKKIYINTFIPENYDSIGNFNFGVSLLPKDILSEEDICALEVPYAIVYFDSEAMEFDYDQTYTEQRTMLEEEISSSFKIPL